MSDGPVYYQPECPYCSVELPLPLIPQGDGTETEHTCGACGERFVVVEEHKIAFVGYEIAESPVIGGQTPGDTSE